MVKLNSGSGHVIDHENFQSGSFPPTPEITNVIWADQDIDVSPYTASYDFSFVTIDMSGSVNLIPGRPPQPQEHRDNLTVGKIIHRDNQVQFVVNLHHKSLDVYNQYADLAEAIGTINIDGNVIEPSASNAANIKKSAGNSFRLNINHHTDIKNPHYTVDAEQTSSVFFAVYRDGAGGYTYSPNNTEIDFGHYDDGSGILQPLGPKYTLKRVYMFPSSGRLYVMYGQSLYTTFDDALEGLHTEPFEGPPANFYDASLRAWIIVRGTM